MRRSRAAKTPIRRERPKVGCPTSRPAKGLCESSSALVRAPLPIGADPPVEGVAGIGLLLGGLDSDVAPGDGVPGVGLHADQARCTATLTVGVVERCGPLPLAGLDVGEEDGVV